MLKDKIYQNSPVFLQNIFVSLYGLHWKYRRFGGVFSKECRAFRKREYYSEAEWSQELDKRLRRILVHSKSQVPYYRNKLKGIDINLINSKNIHEYVSVLTKRELRELGGTELVASSREKGGRFYSSSGSTGTPVKILYSLKMHQRYSAALETRVRNWAGLNRNNRRGMIGGRRILPSASNKEPFYRYNIAERQLYFSAYHISPSNVDNYVKGIRKHRLEYLTGYAMSNYLLAVMIKKRGLKPPKMKAIVTSSEILTDKMKNLLSEVYDCRVYDSYSGVECCGLISECEMGKLHISLDVGLIEIIKDDGQLAKPGETGRAICTGFLNYDQPLIRYDIGDRLTLAEDQKCECGRNMPVIKRIEGRVEDVITGPDGRKMVRFHGIFIDLPNVVEGQVIQENMYDYLVRICSTKGLTRKEIDTIKDRMYSQLGSINVRVKVVKEIPPESNGKYKSVISRM